MPDDDDHLGDVFTDALGSAPVPIETEDATFELVVRQARQRVRRRRIAGAALATAVVGTVAVTVAGASRHDIPFYVQTAPPSSTATTATPATPATTTTEPRSTEPARGLLGVEIANSDGRVIGTVPGLPAAQAGMKAGDLIISIDGMHITSPSTITVALEHSHPRDKIQLTWVDAHGQHHSATVELASRP